MKTLFTAKTQRTQRILFFMKSGEADFMKSALGGTSPLRRIKFREAMMCFPWASSFANGKNCPLRSLRLGGELVS
jgi:hypothetical protein